MYDCSVSESASLSQYRGTPHAVLDLHLTQRCWLHLKRSANAGPASLSKAAAVVVALGYQAQ